MKKYKNEDFTKKVWNHVGNYKVNELVKYIPCEDMDKFKKDGVRGQHSYKHIINKELGDYKKYVYLPFYRDEVYNYLVDNDVTRHTDSHNLNSSQTLVFNMILPIKILSGKYENLEYDFTKEIFGIGGKIEVEHSMNDDGGTGRGTEVDLTIEEKDGKLHLFEVKYTENSFGKFPPNKDRQVYIDKLEGNKNKDHNLNINKFVKYNLINKYFKKEIDIDTLDNNYQLIRNLYNVVYDGIEERSTIGTFSVIHSALNESQSCEFENFKDLLNEDAKKLLMNDGFISIEDIADNSIKFFENYEMNVEEKDKLLKHYKMFKGLYVIE